MRLLGPRSPFVAAAALVLVAAGVTQEAPQPAKQTKAQQRAAQRDARLQKVVGEMVRLVEKYAELAFEEPPKVRAATHVEWREIVRREMKPEGARELFELSVGTFGLYLPRVEQVVLSPLVLGPLLKELDDDAPRHVREAVAHQKATVVHEIVHALQEAHFGLPSKLMRAEDDDEILRLKFVIEGHAVLVEELIAEKELGLEDFLARGPYGGLGADPSYLTGRRYFLHVLRTEGMAGVRARLKDPPSYQALLDVARRPLPKEQPPAKGEQEPPPAQQREGGGERGA